MKNKNWYELNDSEQLISPSLLVYPDRIMHNIRTMLKMSQGLDFLRPHIKTHKTAEIVEMQLEQGIYKFKCATIAEAELLAICKAPDILLAMQPVGVAFGRFLNLMRAYPKSKFSTLVDNNATLETFIKQSKERSVKIGLWMDINNGMDRTGILPDKSAIQLFGQMTSDPNVEAMGLHVYDGHIRDTDVLERERNCDRAFETVLTLKKKIEAKGIPVKGIVAGGSPTFPFHSKREGVEASPGTTLLWDAGYGGLFPEMDFLPAAVLLSRIISKPEKNMLCLDLGHKHLAPEMPFPRVQFLGMENCTQKGQSEEHFVLVCENANHYKVGDTVFALPMHVCPTVAKYESLQVISRGKIIKSWRVAARNQIITL